MIKDFQNLCITDDFMFGKVMEDVGLCHDFLECLLQKDIGELKPVIPQREFRSTLDGKPVRLDIYTTDSTEVFDAEMQNLNHKSIKSLELPKRSRYYQATMDTDFLKKHMSYKALMKSEVIFICTFDPFELGRWKYSFTEICEEDPSLELGAGVNKKFFNCSYTGEDVPLEIRELFKYMRDGVISNALTKRLDDAVCAVRMSEKWRSDYMKELLYYEDLREDARAEGLEKGRAEGREEGRAEGLEEGRAEGLEEGRAEGREEGRAEGREEGRAEGREEGRAEGREEGRAEGLEESRAYIEQLETRIKELEHIVESLSARR